MDPCDAGASSSSSDACSDAEVDEAEQSQQDDDRDVQRSDEKPDHQSRAAVARARKADVAALFASLRRAKTTAGNKNEA